jgi:hypothetical protein
VRTPGHMARDTCLPPVWDRVEETCRRVLQRIATRMSLVSEAIGFSILGILIIVNRHQAELEWFLRG